MTLFCSFHALALRTSTFGIILLVSPMLASLRKASLLRMISAGTYFFLHLYSKYPSSRKLSSPNETAAASQPHQSLV